MESVRQKIVMTTSGSIGICRERRNKLSAGRGAWLGGQREMSLTSAKGAILCGSI